MKTRINLVLAALALLCFAGCQTTSVPEKSPAPATSLGLTHDDGALAVRTLVKTGGAFVLANNPDLAPACLALAAAGDLALDGVPLTVESIKLFMDSFAVKWNLDQQKKVLLASMIQDVTDIYAQKHGMLPGSVIFDPVRDPVARAYLKAFSSALRDAVQLNQAFNAPPS